MFINSTLYNLGFHFIIFSFLGWLMETVLCTYNEKEFINRGFLNGPYCPIYGTGMCMIIFFLSRFENNIPALFIFGMILTTALEYAVGDALERLFKAKWWDYSHKKFNIKGYVCLEITLCWGVLCVVMMEVVVPFFDTLIHGINVFLGQIILIVYFILLFADCAVTVYHLINFNKILANLTKVKAEYMEQFMDSELYLKTEALKERYDSMIDDIKDKWETRDANGVDYELIAANWKKRLTDLSDDLKSEERYKEFVQKAEEITTKYKEMLNKPNFVQKRIIKAYPGFTPRANKYSFKELKEKITERRNK